MKFFSVVFLFILQIFGETSEIEEGAVRVKRQFDGGHFVNFPGGRPQTFDFTTPQTFVIGNQGSFIPSFCRGNKITSPECKEYNQGIGFPNQGGGSQPPNCRGNRKRRPECQGQGGGFGRPNRPGPPNCRGHRKRLPECQGQGGGNRPVNCKGRNKHRPECQDQGSPGGVTDEAILAAFNQISWLQRLTDKHFVSLPGLPETPTNSQQSRFYQLAEGARDEPFQQCATPSFEPGHCRFLQHCVLSNFVQNFNLFLRYVCIIDGIYVGVCCPDSRYPDQFTTSTQAPTTPRPVSPEPTPPSSKGQCGTNSLQQTKIVGGRNTQPKKFPWAAALLRNQATQYCGGVLISDRHVLTASHCVDGFDRSTIIIRLGEYSFDQQNESPHKDFKVNNIKMHEQYDTSTYENDIAILTLDRTTEFTTSIWPVCLPTKDETYSGKIATVIGWGTIYFGGPVSSVLQEVSIPVWENTECNNSYTNNEVFPINLCAGSREGGKDSCQGDSGGPLMIQDGFTKRWTVIGVVSWGIRCAEPGFPGVYARVSKFTGWIGRNTA